MPRCTPRGPGDRAVPDHRVDVVDRAEAEALLSAMLAVLGAEPLSTGGRNPAGSPPVPARDVDCVRERAHDPAVDELLEHLRGWAAELLPGQRRPLDDTEDLFEAGADSVGLLRLAARAQRAGWHVQTRRVFEQPTLLGVASAASRMEVAPGPESSSDRPGSRPATPTERRMWLLEQVGDLPRGAYVVPTAMHVRGPLRTDVLAQAFRLLGERHRALRTTIAGASGGSLTATIHHDARLHLQVLPEARDAGQVARDQVAEGLDPTRLPLARASVAERAPGEWLVVATVHHVRRRRPFRRHHGGGPVAGVRRTAGRTSAPPAVHGRRRPGNRDVRPRGARTLLVRAPGRRGACRPARTGPGHRHVGPPRVGGGAPGERGTFRDPFRKRRRTPRTGLHAPRHAVHGPGHGRRHGPVGPRQRGGHLRRRALVRVGWPPKDLPTATGPTPSPYRFARAATPTRGSCSSRCGVPCWMAWRTERCPSRTSSRPGARGARAGRCSR